MDSVCTESHAFFLVRGQAFFGSVRMETALASSCEDKPPLVTPFGARSPLPASSCEVGLACFLVRGQALPGLCVHGVLPCILVQGSALA